MEYQQALIIGRRRRSEAALALSMYMQERATDVCAVKPAKDQGMDAKEWEPVGEQSFKEICIRTSLSGDKEAYLVLTDADGTVKACSQRVYPMQIALQIAWTIPLPSYAAPGGALMAEAQEEAMRKAQHIAQLPEV